MMAFRLASDHAGRGRPTVSQHHGAAGHDSPTGKPLVIWSVTPQPNMDVYVLRMNHRGGSKLARMRSAAHVGPCTG